MLSKNKTCNLIIYCMNMALMVGGPNEMNCQIISWINECWFLPAM